MNRYEVIDLHTDESHGIYDSIAEARGCVRFDRLRAYAIWLVDSEGESVHRVEVCDPYTGTDDRAKQGLGLPNYSEA